MAQPGFFDFEQRCDQLADKRDPLVALEKAIDWQRFRPVLERVRDKDRKNNSGRKAYGVVLMFKVLVLKSLYSLSHENLEYQIRDRVSFMRFLGLTLHDDVPDEKTIWLFEDALTKRGLVKTLFEQFDVFLNEKGFAACKGSLIDARIVEVPRQRNSREENEQIKAGQRPASFDEKPAKGRQKDTDARWTVKRKQNYFGYKNHINADAKHKIIRKYEVTDAATHDSQVFDELLDERNRNKDVYGDGAYRSEAISQTLQSEGYRDRIHRRAYRNRPLSQRSQAANRKKSRVRVRVEHIFGRQAQFACHVGKTLLRGIGLAKATALIGLANLTYNLDRYRRLTT
jgi:IS5 family transposase